MIVGSLCCNGKPCSSSGNGAIVVVEPGAVEVVEPGRVVLVGVELVDGVLVVVVLLVGLAGRDGPPASVVLVAPTLVVAPSVVELPVPATVDVVDESVDVLRV